MIPDPVPAGRHKFVTVSLSDNILPFNALIANFRQKSVTTHVRAPSSADPFPISSDGSRFQSSTTSTWMTDFFSASIQTVAAAKVFPGKPGSGGNQNVTLQTELPNSTDGAASRS